jgi:hypothetical protein
MMAGSGYAKMSTFRPLALAASLIVASGSIVCPAVQAKAGEAPHCMSLAKAQKAAGKDTAITALTSEQFHFLQGMYVALPTTPEGLPPGDGALLLTRDKGEAGLILWTRGMLACDPLPVDGTRKLLKVLADVKAHGGDGHGL